MVHPAALPPEELLAGCEVRRLRRGGPGGQHRNKVETAVVLSHRETGIEAEANERRTQEENRKVALRRLRTRLALGVRQPVSREDFVPSSLWQQRRQGTRIAINVDHQDFPAVLAELLDVIHAVKYEVADAAERLGITSSQALKVLRLEPAALQQVNNERVARGLRPLR